MASPCKRLCLVVLVLGCVLQAAQGEKWRAMPKMIRRCPGPPRAIENLSWKFTLKNRGTTFQITADINLTKNVTITMGKLNVYKSGGIQNLLFLTWAVPDACSKIMEGHHLIDPLFAPEAFPRQCDFSEGVYPIVVDYDLHGDAEGVKIRGDFLVEIQTYDKEEMIWCAHIHANVRKDTVN